MKGKYHMFFLLVKFLPLAESFEVCLYFYYAKYLFHIWHQISLGCRYHSTSLYIFIKVILLLNHYL